jgi:hypothetical protein
LDLLLADEPGTRAGRLTLVLKPGLIVGRLAIGAVVLVVMGALVAVSRVEFDHGQLHGLVALFDLDNEANLPATYAGALLGATAGALWLVAAWKQQFEGNPARRVRLLSFVLVVMAFDEIAQLHELLSKPVRNSLHLGGALYFAWVVVYAVIAVVLLAIYARSLLQLASRTRARVVAGVGIYVLGALGLELVGAFIVDAGNRDGRAYAVLTTIEEALEFAGVLVVLYTILTSLQEMASSYPQLVDPARRNVQ